MRVVQHFPPVTLARFITSRGSGLGVSSSSSLSLSSYSSELSSSESSTVLSLPLFLLLFLAFSPLDALLSLFLLSFLPSFSLSFFPCSFSPVPLLLLSAFSPPQASTLASSDSNSLAISGSSKALVLSILLLTFSRSAILLLAMALCLSNFFSSLPCAEVRDTIIFCWEATCAEITSIDLRKRANSDPFVSSFGEETGGGVTSLPPFVILVSLPLIRNSKVDRGEGINGCMLFPTNLDVIYILI
mmetsp:Transcript_11679/g.23907  ORF Transcript_11679/g.23907 Transcript_11679/m.23907 type:complete len:244 (-) Transcript_11679:73-804(-)